MAFKAKRSFPEAETSPLFQGYFFRQNKTPRRTFLTDLLRRMKLGSITMIQKLRPSQNKGSTVTRHAHRPLGVMIDFLAKYITITGAHYASLLEKLREAIKSKCCGM